MSNAPRRVVAGLDADGRSCVIHDERIAFPADSPGFAEQSQRLRAEGVDVRNGRVRMPKQDSLDAVIWSPR